MSDSTGSAGDLLATLRLSNPMSVHGLIPTPNPLLSEAQANHASEFYKRLVNMINAFDAELDSAEEVGVRLVSFGATVVFHLRDLSYWNPSLISFQGVTDDGNPVELIQHVTQISLLLMKVPRKDPSAPKRQFGFRPQAEPAESVK